MTLFFGHLKLTVQTNTAPLKEEMEKRSMQLNTREAKHHRKGEVCLLELQSLFVCCVKEQSTMWHRGARHLLCIYLTAASTPFTGSVCVIKGTIIFKKINRKEIQSFNKH